MIRVMLIGLSLLLVVVAVYLDLHRAQPSIPSKQPKTLAALVLDRVPTPPLPDPKLTPGSHFNVTLKQLCTSGYADSVRNVNDSVKKHIYTEYSMTPHVGKCSKNCEVDHLISLEIGGDNQKTNLWIQPFEPVPGAHEKDYLEGLLHREVCAHKITLADAQQCIASNWWACYKAHISDPK